MNKQHVAYTESLNDHIKNVQEAGVKIGVDLQQLGVHDQSKYDDVEFAPYADYFYDENGAKRKNNTTPAQQNAFTRAWLNHLHNNLHHWQYWLIPNGFTHGEMTANSVLEMPENYALEMIADWMGASKTYTGSWDMSAWLKNNLPNVMVHPTTAEYLTKQLIKIGYTDVMKSVRFNVPDEAGED